MQADNHDIDVLHLKVKRNAALCIKYISEYIKEKQRKALNEGKYPPDFPEIKYLLYLVWIAYHVHYRKDVFSGLTKDDRGVNSFAAFACEHLDISTTFFIPHTYSNTEVSIENMDMVLKELSNLSKCYTFINLGISDEDEDLKDFIYDVMYTFEDLNEQDLRSYIFRKGSAFYCANNRNYKPCTLGVLPDNFIVYSDVVESECSENLEDLHEFIGVCRWEDELVRQSMNAQFTKWYYTDCDKNEVFNENYPTSVIVAKYILWYFKNFKHIKVRSLEYLTIVMMVCWKNYFDNSKSLHERMLFTDHFYVSNRGVTLPTLDFLASKEKKKYRIMAFLYSDIITNQVELEEIEKMALYERIDIDALNKILDRIPESFEDWHPYLISEKDRPEIIPFLQLSDLFKHKVDSGVLDVDSVNVDWSDFYDLRKTISDVIEKEDAQKTVANIDAVIRWCAAKDGAFGEISPKELQELQYFEKTKNAYNKELRILENSCKLIAARHAENYLCTKKSFINNTIENLLTNIKELPSIDFTRNGYVILSWEKCYNSRKDYLKAFIHVAEPSRFIEVVKKDTIVQTSLPIYCLPKLVKSFMVKDPYTLY